MYEIEVDHIRLASGALPPDVRGRFLEPRHATHLGHIKWEEHCTECAYPQCYTTCDLYSPRNDGNCRRTIDGFSPVMDTAVLGGHVVRVKFKRWANLTAHCHLTLLPVSIVERTERRLNMLSRAAASLPTLGASIGRTGLPSRIVRRLKNRSVDAEPSSEAGCEPNCFVIEVYNPSQRTVELSLDIAARGKGVQLMPFKRLLKIAHGFQRVRIPFEEIRPSLGEAREANLGVNPNILHAEEEGLTLFFGLMNFAFDPSLGAVKTPDEKKVKVMVWDLDNTVWNGTLIEDGIGNVTLKPGVLEVIQALDRRGIVNSVASKNHENVALEQLERFGLREYFVFPMIGWGPKSDAVRRITRSFNVGEDTIAFIDDQPFEREEVRAGNPKVRVFRHDQYTELLERAEFDVPVTDEARGRRLFYQNEEVRQQVLEESNGDYLAFLKQSDIRVRIETASVDQLDRIHELVQRTNQMNFSGNRYSKQDLLATLASAERECYLIEAEDNYGKYGYIGFVVVKPGSVPRVVDLAFSCRVQSKRVEHAVLIFLMGLYADRGASDFEVGYHATDRNAQVAQVFPDLGFAEAFRKESDFVYRRSIAGDLPENSVITVHFSAPVEPVQDAAS
jgi:FkbH-like protein